VTGADGRIYALGGANGSSILTTLKAYTPAHTTR